MSGLFGSMTASVSGLRSQSEAISVISDNLANANTIGYKNARALFSQLVTSSGVSGTLFNAGGVQSDVLRNQASQGTFLSTSSTTDLALSGNGFFMVSDNSVINNDTGIFYTRAGAFTEDKDGFLVSPGGNYLQGWELDGDGNIIDLQNPTSIELRSVGVSAAATGNLSFGVNVSSEETVHGYDTTTTRLANLNTVVGSPTTADYLTDMRVYDAQGTARDVTMAFTKRSDNMWDWTLYTDGANLVGGTTGTDARISDGVVEFNSDGTLKRVTNKTVTANWSGGVPIGTIDIDFGDETGGFFFNTIPASLDFDTGNAADDEADANGSNFSTEATITPTTAAQVGDYTLAFNNGTNTYTLTAPDTSTQAIVDAGGYPKTLNFSTLGISMDLSAAFNDTGATQNIGTFNIARTGNILGTTFDATKYAAVHGSTASPVGNFAVSYDVSDGEMDITDPAGSTYSVAVPATAATRTLEFGNGVTMTLSANWTAPTDDYSYGNLVISTPASAVGDGDGSGGIVQFATNYNTSFVNQDGFASGNLSSVTVDGEGFVSGSFTNGETKQLWKIAIAVFQNPSELDPVNNSLLRETDASGAPLLKEAGVAGTASVESGALEQSTVDVANEFSQMIVTQRSYQASSTVVSTVDQMLNQLMQLR